MILFIFLLFCLSFGLYGYGTSEHADITEKAISNYQTWVAGDPDNRVGSNALDSYSTWIVSGSIEEDTHCLDTPFPWRQHYYDPVTGNGLFFIIRYASAYDRAIDENHWPAAFDYYEDGDYQMAYWTLGRVMHLVEDCGVPAHVQLDRHFYHEWYEKEYIPSHRLTETDISNLDAIYTLDGIMFNLATIADQFDSDGDNSIVKGTTTKVNADDGWTEAEGYTIASECYTGAIKSAGEVLRLWFYIVQPTIQFQKPLEGSIHSGIIGVPFEGQAKTYNKDFSEPWRIQKIEFYYSEIDNPTVGDWTLAGIADEYDEEQIFKHTWNSGIDDDKFWVRAIAIDDGDCESVVSEKYWIKIDSTRPTVDW